MELEEMHRKIVDRWGMENFFILLLYILRKFINLFLGAMFLVWINFVYCNTLYLHTKGRLVYGYAYKFVQPQEDKVVSG